MKRINSKSFILTNIFSVVIFLNIFYLDTYSQEKSASNFNPISSQEAVKNMSPGWNLANTLEAIPTEGSWNNPPAEEYIFDDIKKAGFRSVRIPVTWYTHFGPAPDYKVDPKWMDRVEQVVDWALKRDLYVMIDVHFDSEWVSRMVIDPATGNYVNNYGNSIVKLEKLWGQIAERFKWKNEKLLLEVLNEPIDGNEPIKGDKVEDKFGKPKSPNNPEARYDLTQEQVNDMNRRVVSLIRKSGGYNDKRLVVIPGIASNVNPVEQILKSFKAPDDKYIIFTSHYYLPWEFTNNQCGRTSWGTFEEKQAVEQMAKQFYEKFIKNGLPIIVGEWGTLVKNDKLSRWYYHDYLAKTGYKYGIACLLWDNGLELCQYYDRKNRVWRDEILKDVTVNAGKGIPNSFIFPVDNYFKVNTDVTEDLTVKLELNGNELLNIYNAEKKLVRGTDYVVDTQNLTVTIKKDYLAKLLAHPDVAGESEKLGTIATLKFDFSKGIDMPLNIIRYDLPKFPEGTIVIDKSKTQGKIQSDMVIPVSFNGTKLDKISLVDKENKKPIMNSGTPYLWMSDREDDSFDYTDTGIILKKGILNSLKTDSLFTFEFLPRDIKVEMEALLASPYIMFTVNKDTN